MVDVIMRRIRRSRARSAQASEPSLTGYLMCEPRVGSSMVLVRPATGRRTVTSPVVRILCDDCKATVYAETTNSIYRIEICAPNSPAFS